MELQRVSTNGTLILRIVIPVIWIAFFGTFTILALVVRAEEVPMMQLPIFKIGLISFFLLGLLIIRFTLLRLKRVDMTQEEVYVTNYFKTYKYTFDSFESIDELDYLIFRVVKLKLKSKGSFGRTLLFIPSRDLWTGFVGQNPDLFRPLIAD